MTLFKKTKQAFSLIIKNSFNKKVIVGLLAVQLYALQLMAQVTVTGTIRNESDQPLPFASVTVKQTGVVTLSDDKGAFNLVDIDSTAMLLISCTGYTSRQYKLKAGTRQFTITLQAAVQELEGVEVMSSGYQDIAKERATGSFTKIDSAMLNQQTGINILQRLSGVTSGLLLNVGRQNNNPQNKTNISIRGLSTIKGPLDPLVVLDGFIYEGDISNINPNDIENITVLKDATASSIWGARAGNGVIVLNTKRGKFNQPLQVNFNADVIVSAKTDLFDVPQLSSSSYIDVEQYLFNQGYFDYTINTPYLALTPAVEIFLKKRNGLITAADSAAQVNALKSIDSRDQYKKYVYRNAVTQQFALNIQGGTNNNAYTFSAGYEKNISELSAENRKINIRVDNLFQPVKKLKLNISTYYTNSNSASGKQGFGLTEAGRQIPYLRLADDNGRALPVASYYRNAYTDTAGAGKLLDWKYYPLEDYKHATTKTNLQELYATAGLQYKINRYLDIDLKYQYEYQWSVQEQLNDVESFAARNLINEFSQLDRTTGVVTYKLPYGGFRTLTNSKISSQTLRGQLNFNHAGKKHILSAIAGAERRQVKATGDGSTAYGYNADPLTATVADYINYYPQFITGYYGLIPSKTGASENMSRFISLYANAAYTWCAKYTLSASARRDGSNIFGANTNDKWKPLWSVGAGWKISDEPFYKSSLLPSLKMRVTYGYSGNVDLSKTAAAVGYYSTSSINLPYITINTLNNPNLRWEKTGIFNVGADFEFKHNIITGSLEYYLKHGRDLYGYAYYDYTTWGLSNLVTRNIAAMKGKGVDLVLNAKLTDRAIKWNSTLLLNYNTAKTTKYANDEAKGLGGFISNGSNITPVIGKPLYAIAAYKWGGLNSSGDPQGFLNGELSTDYTAIVNNISDTALNASVRYVGPSSPPVFGSIINTVSWKGFSLTANISYRFGYFFRKTSFTSAGIIAGGGHPDYEKRWQQPGDEAFTNVPAFTYPSDYYRDAFYAASEVNVLKAGNIRLQYINLSYAFTNNLFKKMPFKNIQLYANVSNIGILWRANKEGLDPDYPDTYRPVKTFAFGIRGGF